MRCDYGIDIGSRSTAGQHHIGLAFIVLIKKEALNLARILAGLASSIRSSYKVSCKNRFLVTEGVNGFGVYCRIKYLP